MKTLNELIDDIKESLFEQDDVQSILYYYLKNKNFNDLASFDGEVECISVNSFQGNLVDSKDLEKIQKKISNVQYEKSINIFNWIGLALQELLLGIGSDFFKKKLNGKFKEHSFRYKYLIARAFEDYIEELKKFLKAVVDNNDSFVSILKHIYLEESINVNTVLRNFQKEASYDIIDLLLLEDLKDIKSIAYDRTQKSLLSDILWILSEVQSNHKNHNKSEDQYNSAIRSLLSAKGYIVQDQTQRGQSSTGKSTGELDIEIFTSDNIPLSIFEAFNLSSIESSKTTNHLLKLSKNYDPNGIKQNYAVIYSKAKDFNALWNTYKDFVITINFEYEIVKKEFKDITLQYPNYAGLRIGETKHQNRGIKTTIYHFFLDMNF
ncbi:MAG: hypothetical protein IT258_12090 [Saprospiraceae bacterium]|nr:hypothetical protein [Saprospiraceae bacterium]